MFFYANKNNRLNGKYMKTFYTTEGKNRRYIDDGKK
jgi:hypothetical protein